MHIHIQRIHTNKLSIQSFTQCGVLCNMLLMMCDVYLMCPLHLSPAVSIYFSGQRLFFSSPQQVHSGLVAALNAQEDTTFLNPATSQSSAPCQEHPECAKCSFRNFEARLPGCTCGTLGHRVGSKNNTLSYIIGGCFREAVIIIANHIHYSKHRAFPS